MDYSDFWTRGNEQAAASVASVLSNDKILDKIIEFAIWDWNSLPNYLLDEMYSMMQEYDICCPYDNDLLTDVVTNLRLVNSTWLKATTRVLRKYRDPLFRVGGEIGVRLMAEGRVPRPLCGQGPLICNNWNWERCLINPFVDVMCPRNDNLYVCQSEEEGAGWEVPTFRLEFYADYFKQENQNKMANILAKLGSGLVCLRLQFALDSTMVIKLPSFKLPHLKTLVVNCDEVLMNGDAPLPPQRYQRSGMMPAITGNFQQLVEVILTAAEELKELEFQNISKENQYYFPSRTFTNIRLPGKLQKFKFQLQDAASLRILIAPQNSSIQLTTLTLIPFNAKPYDTDLIYNVLKKFENSLVRFFMLGENGASISEDERSKVKFPVMTALKTVEMLSGQWTLDRRESNLAEKLPNLENLSLSESTYSVFKRQWTNGSVFEKGNKLSLQLLKKKEEPDADNRQTFKNRTSWLHSWPGDAYPHMNCPKISALYPYIPLTLEVIQDVRNHFPNISQLHLSFLESEVTSGLKSIFKEMTNLIRLELLIVRNPARPMPKHFWDEVFIGYPEGMLQDYESWDSAKMVNPSIRNLTKLENLFLSMPMDRNGKGGGFSSVITKYAFQFGFMQAPSLKHLKMAGGFKPSNKMIGEWAKLHSEERGTIRYFRTKDIYWAFRQIMNSRQ